MITLSPALCWAVLAPLPISDLQRIAADEWHRDFPYAIDLPPWEAVSGTGRYSALTCREPGTEGADREFAPIFSTLAKDETVYSLWLDHEREAVFEWRDGAPAGVLDADPWEIAESLGFDVPPRDAPTPPQSVAVVEDASIDDVRLALGDTTDET